MELSEALTTMERLKFVPTDHDEDFGEYLISDFGDYTRGTPLFDIYHDLEQACPEFTVTEYKNKKY